MLDWLWSLVVSLISWVMSFFTKSKSVHFADETGANVATAGAENAESAESAESAVTPQSTQ